MRASLQGICRRFIENRDTVKSVFGWESAYMVPVCAAVITDKGMRIDAARLENCKAILHEQTGVFSNFRSTAKLALVAMMAVDSNPSAKLSHALAVYDLLKDHFFSSQYLPTASMLIAESVDPSRYAEVAERTRRIYDLVRKAHPFLTSGEDCGYIAALALSEKGDEQIAMEVEACYRLLKNEFCSGNSVQSLAFVLALGEGDARQKCQATLALYNALKDKGCKFGTVYELAALGALALLPADRETIVQDIVEADAWLAKEKGYGFFGLGRQQRLLHAGLLVATDYAADNDRLQIAATQGALALIAAQEAAMCAAIAATAAANASN